MEKENLENEKDELGFVISERIDRLEGFMASYKDGISKDCLSKYDPQTIKEYMDVVRKLPGDKKQIVVKSLEDIINHGKMTRTGFDCSLLGTRTGMALDMIGKYKGNPDELVREVKEYSEGIVEIAVESYGRCGW